MATLIVPFDGRPFPAALAALREPVRDVVLVHDPQPSVARSAHDLASWLRDSGRSARVRTAPDDTPDGWAQALEVEAVRGDVVIDVSGACPTATVAATRLASERGWLVESTTDDGAVVHRVHPDGASDSAPVDVVVNVADILAAHGRAPLAIASHREAVPDEERMLAEFLGLFTPELGPLIDRLRAHFTVPRLRNQREFRFELRSVPRDAAVRALDAAISAELVEDARVGPGRVTVRPAPTQRARDFFAGDWLERYAFSRFELLEPDDLVRGVQVDWDADAEDSTKFEIDIAATVRDRLVLVECKSGRRLAKSPDDVIDHLRRLAVLRDSLGRTWAEAMLIVSQRLRSSHRLRTHALELGVTLVDGAGLPSLHETLAGLRPGRRT